MSRSQTCTVMEMAVDRSALKLPVFLAACVVAAVASHAAGDTPGVPSPRVDAGPAELPGPTQRDALIDTSSPFAHDTHLNAKKMGTKLDCRACHAVVNDDATCPKAEVRFPKHEACAGCHATSFFTPPLTICVTCHKSAQFQAKNPLKDISRQATPRKAEFSHARHLAADRGADCTSCHAFQRAGLEIAHPGHASCCACHAEGASRVPTAGADGAGAVATGPAKPAMTQCGGCHTESRTARRPPSIIHDFSHKKHREDPRTGTSLSCRSCHVNAAAATSLRTIPTPPMSTCVGCHDGSSPEKPNPRDPTQRGTGAFHFSACLKCHIEGQIGGKPVPPTHDGPAATTDGGSP